MKTEEIKDFAIEGFKMIAQIALASSNPIAAGIGGIAKTALSAIAEGADPEAAYREMKALADSIAENDTEADKKLEEKFSN